MIVGVCLAILAILSLLSVVLGENFIASPVTTTIDNEAIVDGETSTFQIDAMESDFAIDPIVGALVMFIVIAAVVAIIGFRVLGSGLSEESVKIITMTIAYAGMWGVLSAISFNLVVAIETFGPLIYISLTIVFVVGIFQKNIGGE